MAVDHENPHEWFTAGEVADLARREGITEVPQTKSGMIKWLRRSVAADPDGFGNKAKRLSRTRTGQKGGGGQEYHLSLFQETGRKIRVALIRNARDCAGEALTSIPASAAAEDAAIRQSLEWLGISDDWFPDDGDLKKRVVRRGSVYLAGREYDAGREFEHSHVVVRASPHPTLRDSFIALIWKYHPTMGKGDFLTACISRPRLGWTHPIAAAIKLDYEERISKKRRSVRKLSPEMKEHFIKRAQVKVCPDPLSD